MRRVTMLVAAVLMCIACAQAADNTAQATESTASWHALPDLLRRDGVISGMGVDSGGTLWVMTNTAPSDLS